MFNDGLLMLVIMNPFAQMVYLSKLIDETEPRQFVWIYLQGSFLAYIVFLFCAFAGEILLFQIFQVTPASMRIFGGLINLQLSYQFVMRGSEGLKLFGGDVTELAQQIALPVMVGAGTVWASIRIGKLHSPGPTLMIIAGVLVVNAVAVLAYQALFNRAHERKELALVKYFGMAMRFNALLIGAVSIEMILGGVRDFIEGGI